MPRISWSFTVAASAPYKVRSSRVLRNPPEHSVLGREESASVGWCDQILTD